MRAIKYGVAALALTAMAGCGAQADGETEATGDVATASEDGTGETSQALVNGFQAFARVNAAGGVIAANSFSTTGGAITAINDFAGGYRVTLGNMSDAGTGGNVQVVALGANNVRCKTSGWAPSGASMVVNVRCHTPNGFLTNSEFFVRFAKVFAAAGFGTGAYMRTTAAFAPGVEFSWNSTGGVNTVFQEGTGKYTVTLPGLARRGGGVQITAIGTTGPHCKVLDWFDSGGSELVRVRCFEINGAPVDARFSLNFIGNEQSVGIRNRGAFVWASSPELETYSPPAEWSKNTGNVAGTCTAVNVAGRIIPNGPFVIFHQNMSILGASPHVTAYGDNPNYCKLVGLTAQGTGAQVRTECFSPNGQVAPLTQYAETFARRDTAGPCP